MVRRLEADPVKDLGLLDAAVTRPQSSAFGDDAKIRTRISDDSILTISQAIELFEQDHKVLRTGVFDPDDLRIRETVVRMPVDSVTLNEKLHRWRRIRLIALSEQAFVGQLVCLEVGGQFLLARRGCSSNHPSGKSPPRNTH